VNVRRGGYDPTRPDAAWSTLAFHAVVPTGPDSERVWVAVLVPPPPMTLPVGHIVAAVRAAVKSRRDLFGGLGRPPRPAPLSDADVERYSRQLVLPRVERGGAARAWS
jgi:hypothetical protein